MGKKRKSKIWVPDDPSSRPYLKTTPGPAPFPGELKQGPPSLKGAWRKLERAKFHRDSLESEFRTFVTEQLDRMVFKPDDEHERIYATGDPVENLADQPWPLIIGDCIQNARIALEYAVFELARLPKITTKQTSSEGTGQRYFPLCSDEPDWNKRVKVGGYLDGVNVEDVATIKRFQPYQRANLGGVSSEYLGIMGRRSNRDKHRLLITTSPRATLLYGPRTGPHMTLTLRQDDFFGGVVDMPIPAIGMKDEIRRIKRAGGKFDPAEYAKGNLAFHIEFPDSSVDATVHQTLRRICAAVEHVLGALESSFRT